MACICSICQNTIQSNKAAALLCGHIFDMQCINTWIGHSPVCPICRTFTRYENIIPVFLTNDDQEEGQALSDDFAGLIDQLDNIRITKGKLSLKQIKRLENLHRIHSKEISNLANQLDKVENEKQKMEVDRQKRFERLCKIHTDEMASLSHHSPKGEPDFSWEIHPFMRYETLRALHSNEFTALDNKMDSEMNGIKEKLLQYQLRLEALANTEIKYRELRSDYNQQLHVKFFQ